MVQYENCQPSLGIATRLRASAFAKAYVPGPGVVVPPAEGKTITIAELLRSGGKGRPGTEVGMANEAVTVYVTPPVTVKVTGLSVTSLADPSLGVIIQVVKT